ncbi:MAG: glycosyltransferase family 2 protein [Terriglobia bacterium]
MSDISSPAVSVSAFFPAFNDAENLQVLVPKAEETLGRLADDFEIIVIDDGSTDHTSRVLESLQQQCSNLRVVRHPRNLGYGAALQSGFRNARKELVFYTDGDGQYDVREMDSLFPALSQGQDVVTGYKICRADPIHRTLIGKLYHAVVKVFFGLNVRDVDCDFRLMRRKVLERVPLTCRSGAICVELMCQIERAGFRVAEVPVHHYPRMNGRSQFFRFGPVARTGLDILRLWVRLILLRRSPARP